MLQAFGGFLLALALLLVAVLLLVARREHAIRDDAVKLQADLRTAQQSITGDGADPGGSEARLASAQQALRTLQQHSGALLHETDGVAWSIGSDVPGMSKPLRAVRQLAQVSNAVATQVLPHDVATLADLSHQHVDGGLDLKPLQDRAGALSTDVISLDADLAKVGRIRNTGIGSLDRARQQVITGLRQLDGYARTLAVAAHAAPEMLGADGPRRTLIVLQTPAEARGSGGYVGGYVELDASGGRITLSGSGGNSELIAHNATSPVLNPDPQFQSLYGTRYATTDWRDSDLSPDFTQVGPIWAALYRKATGHTVDGVVGLTPEALARVLAVTGPVDDGPQGVQLTAADAADLLEKGIYARYPAAETSVDNERDAFQQAILQVVISRLLADRGDPLPLLSALGAGAQAGELRLFSTSPASQRWIATTPVAGNLGSAAGPFYGAIVINDDTTKLDAYLRRTVTYRRDPIAGDPAHQQAILTVRLTNTAPAHGLPAYVTFRGDFDAAQRDATPAGTHQVLLDLYLATDASFRSLEVGGFEQSPVLQGRERDHLFVEAVPPDLAPGASTEITLRAVEPTSSAAPTVLAQAVAQSAR